MKSTRRSFFEALSLFPVLALGIHSKEAVGKDEVASWCPQVASCRIRGFPLATVAPREENGEIILRVVQPPLPEDQHWDGAPSLRSRTMRFYDKNGAVLGNMTCNLETICLPDGAEYDLRVRRSKRMVARVV